MFIGVLDVLGGFLRGLGGFGVVFEGFWRFFGVFKVNITIVAIIFLNHQDRLICYRVTQKKRSLAICALVDPT